MLTEIVVPGEGLLPRLTSVLTTVWAGWYQRKDAAGEDPALADRPMNTTAGLRQPS
ncbi:hypothetical protein [Streptomyces sp. NPDC004726]